jgi:hypothetical protein
MYKISRVSGNAWHIFLEGSSPQDYYHQWFKGQHAGEIEVKA